MAENGRLRLLERVIDAFEDMMRGHRNEVLCIVTTAKPLDNSSQGEVTSVIKSMLKPDQKLNLKLEIKPSIIGGMIVRIGDKYVDMSISKRIETLERLIKEPT
ncbi:unnamed protein product [Protopolystoma xenopodis]|uniref:ATP synthase peripheral stalk subunit OSCP, mitochondrial n=1 Tax=Protopolystoma xenopodis TaxID=117903 RepID=A0A448WXS2_9PLAT|nr:unnamed protein product [Protopolystoma xenopodis]